MDHYKVVGKATQPEKKKTAPMHKIIAHFCITDYLNCRIQNKNKDESLIFAFQIIEVLRYKHHWF